MADSLAACCRGSALTESIGGGYCFWEVDAEILKALDDWIALLAAKEYEKFHDSASARPDPFSTSESWKRVLDELLPTLRATKRLVPR